MHSNDTKSDRGQAIEKHGFAVIDASFSSEEIDPVIAALTRSELKRTKAGVRHALKYKAVADLAREPRLLCLAREVLGQNAEPYRATIFDKSLDANWLVVWHQDTALPLRKKHNRPGWGPWSTKEGILYAHAPAEALCHVLALRIHLDQSSAENGPLKVLPGTHILGVLTDEQIEDLVAKISPVECLLSRGGVLAMRPLVVHASSKAHSEVPRRVIHIEYANKGAFGEDVKLATA